VNTGRGRVVKKWAGPPHEDIPRCGAKTRSGGLCGHYSMKNGRCRYHGGKSTGAKNPPVKHGMYTKESIEERKWLNEIISEANRFAVEICD
jgi:hypothetical protein